MALLMLILAAIPAIIAVIQWWNAKKQGEPPTLKEATELLKAINAKVAGRKGFGPVERLALAQLRRRCQQALECRGMADTDPVIAFGSECSFLINHCQRVGIEAAAQDSELKELKGSEQ